MIRVKITSVEVSDPQPPVDSLLFESIKVEGLITKKQQNTNQEFVEENLKSNYVLITEKEFNERVLVKASRKSNPLMLNFEEYE